MAFQIPQPKLLALMLALCASASALPSENPIFQAAAVNRRGFISLPLSRSAAPIKEIQKRDGVPRADLSTSYYRTTIDIAIGPEPNSDTFSLLLGSGSHITVVGYRDNHRPAVTKTSKSTEMVHYRVDGSGTKAGPIFTDTIHFAGLSIPDQMISNTTVHTPYPSYLEEGIFGLSHSRNDWIYGGCGDPDYLNPVDNAHKQGIIKDRIWGVQMCPLKKEDYASILDGKKVQNSFFSFGGIDDSLYTGEMWSVSQSADPAPLAQTAWTIDTVGLKVGDLKTGNSGSALPESAPTMVQTALDFNQCSDRIFQGLVSQLPWEVELVGDMALVSSDFKRKDSQGSGDVNDLEITFTFNVDDGSGKTKPVDFPFKGEQLFLPEELNPLYQVPAGKRVFLFRSPATFRPGQGRELLIGQPFFERYFAAFDHEKRTVSFAVNTCSTAANAGSGSGSSSGSK